MIKCEVIKRFNLNDFNKLTDIVRKNISNDGELYVGDTFKCDEEMAKYLTGNNDKNAVVVRILEVEPSIENVEKPKRTRKTKK